MPIELSPHTKKVALELATAFQALTPENIKACAIAEAESLKLTEPERKKRDEANAIIDGVTPKLKALELAQKQHAQSLQDIANANEIAEKAIAAGLSSNEKEAERLRGIEAALTKGAETLKQNVAQHNQNVADLALSKKLHLANVQAFENSKKAAKEKSKAALAEIDAA